MKVKSLLLIITAMLLIGAIIAGCAAPAPTPAPAPAPAPAPEKPSYTIKLAQYQGLPEMQHHQTALRFQASVEKASGGRITISHYPGDLLGDWEVQELNVKKGALDMTIALPSAGYDPDSEFVILPYIIFDWEGVQKVYGPGGPGAELAKKIQERNNAHFLAAVVTSPVVIHGSKRWVPMPGDPSMKELKIRVMPSKMEEITGKALGFGTVLSMPWSEVASAYMLGTIDGVMSNNTLEAITFKDHMKYCYKYSYILGADDWVINMDLWNSLPAEDQGIIQSAMEEAAQWANQNAEVMTQDTLTQMEEAGIEVIELTPEQMSANIEVCRDQVWPWAEENMLSKEVMDFIREQVAQPVPSS